MSSEIENHDESSSMNYKSRQELGDYTGQFAYSGESINYPMHYPSDGVSYGSDARGGAVYINPKQVYWIRRRKIRREMLDSIMVRQDSNYMHESRHQHAMKRLRAPSGRFLTKEEMAEAKRKGNFEDKSNN